MAGKKGDIGMPVQAHLVVRGKVQGVYFRLSTKEQADALGLAGWVRNCSDGSVEMVVRGDSQSIEKLIAWCYYGPSHARVKDVRVDWQKEEGEMSDFAVRN